MNEVTLLYQGPVQTANILRSLKKSPREHNFFGYTLQRSFGDIGIQTFGYQDFGTIGPLLELDEQIEEIQIYSAKNPHELKKQLTKGYTSLEKILEKTTLPQRKTTKIPKFLTVYDEHQDPYSQNLELLLEIPRTWGILIYTTHKKDTGKQEALEAEQAYKRVQRLRQENSLYNAQFITMNNQEEAEEAAIKNSGGRQ